LVLVALVVVLLLVGAGLASGAVPLTRGRDSVRPPCEQLTERQAVDDAVAAHEDLAARFRSVGPGVEVEVVTACEGPPPKGIVRITYATDTEREGIESILQQEDGFGAAIEVVGD
jgi:hypothetical protein